MSCGWLRVVVVCWLWGRALRRNFGMKLAERLAPPNQWFERTAGQRCWPVPFALCATAAAQPHRWAAGGSGGPELRPRDCSCESVLQVLALWRMVGVVRTRVGQK